MRIFIGPAVRVKHDRTSCYLRPPLLGTPLAPSRFYEAYRTRAKSMEIDVPSLLLGVFGLRALGCLGLF